MLITTVPLIRNAENSGALRDGKSTLLGSTVAGVAVPPGSPKPDVSSPKKLRAALLAAKQVAVSDPARGATVGTHFMKVIEALGVKDEGLRKITFASDGVETMRLVMEKRVDIGVSQSSEILQASRDAMAGPFPKEFANGHGLFALASQQHVSGGQRLRCSADGSRGPRQICRARSNASCRTLKTISDDAIFAVS